MIPELQAALAEIESLKAQLKEALASKSEANYSFDDIYRAWEASGAGWDQIGFTDFIAHLGTRASEEMAPDPQPSCGPAP